jgi:Domain of unknown function (DUF4844)
MRELRLKAHWFAKWSALAFAACALLFVSEMVMADQTLSITPQMIEQLKALKGRLTFGPDSATHYTGVANPVDRLASGQAFGHLIDVLVVELKKKPSKNFVLNEFQSTLDGLRLSDTEDRERAAGYCEKVMDVLHIASSDGVLNRWMYGPVLGRLVEPKKP